MERPKAVKTDAHQHFWQLTKPFDYRWLDEPHHAPIRRDFLPADLEPRMKAAGIERSVFVQTQHNLDESLWVLEMARSHPFIAGVVGWVDLAGPACEEQVLAMKRHATFVGVDHRHRGGWGRRLSGGRISGQRDANRAGFRDQ